MSSVLALIAILAWPLSIAVCTVILRRAIRAGIDDGIKKSFEQNYFHRRKPNDDGHFSH